MSEAQLRNEIARLTLRCETLEGQLAHRLPPQHYLSQLRTVAAVCASDMDSELCGLGSGLELALDHVEGLRRQIRARLDAMAAARGGERR